MRNLLILVATLGVVGCGGSGAHSTSPFIGTYAGTWVAPSLNDNGTAILTIASDGSLTGTLHDDVSLSDATVSGTLSSSGVTHATVVYAGPATSTLTGTVALGSQGQLSGNLIQTEGGNSVGVTFALVKQ